MKLAGRDNNLNLIRLLAAIAVIYTHAYALTGNSSADPFLATFGIGPGDVGVDIFFFISGMLVTRSFLGRNLVQFVWARASRIFPALWVSTVILVLVAALFWSPLSPVEFVSGPETVSYLYRNMLLLPVAGAQMDLPLAFDTSSTAFNVSLWTLPHELQMYALLTCVGLLGGLSRGWIPAAMAALGAALMVLGHAFDLHLVGPDRARFIFFFFLGATAFFLQARIILNIAGLTVCLSVVALCIALTDSRELRQLVLAFALPYLVLWLAFVPAGLIRRYNALGDYSYGTYIYASPIQLALAKIALITDPFSNLVCTIIIVVPVAILSWRLVEKPALAVPCPPILLQLHLRIARMIPRIFSGHATKDGVPEN